jgi:hypothetical protein
MELNEKIDYLCKSLNSKFDANSFFRVRSPKLLVEKALQYSRMFYSKGPCSWIIELDFDSISDGTTEGDEDGDSHSDDDDDDVDSYVRLSRQSTGFISRYVKEHPLPELFDIDYVLNLVSSAKIENTENATILNAIRQEGFELLNGMATKLHECGPYHEKQFKVVKPTLSAVKAANCYQLLLKELFHTHAVRNPDTRSLYDGFYFHSQYQDDDDEDETEDEEETTEDTD